MFQPLGNSAVEKPWIGSRLSHPEDVWSKTQLTSFRDYFCGRQPPATSLGHEAWPMSPAHWTSFDLPIGALEVFDDGSGHLVLLVLRE